MSNSSILLVDDQPENISILYSLLKEEGYTLLVASTGEDALSIVEEQVPDLILLDVMMSGLNGFEVCRQLKHNPQYAQVPVIFITALTEIDDKLKGFDVGGVDYITKPFQHAEVLARVHSQLTIARQREELQHKNLELEQKYKELDAFSHTVAHDLKNPLSEIISYTTLLQWKLQTQEDNEVHDFMANIHNTAMKISDIIEALLLLAGTSRHQSLYLDKCDMGYVVDKVQERMAFELKQAGVTLQSPDSWPFIVGYPIWLEEIWVNYISNALKYGGQPPQVELGFDEFEDRVRFWVRDNGPGLTPEQQTQLFVPFSRLHIDRADGHGLGLCIAQRIAEKLAGKVGVHSQVGVGSTFYFELSK